MRAVLSARSRNVPEAAEIEDVVPQHRAMQRAAHQRGLLADRGQHLGQVAGADGRAQRVLQDHVGVVDGLPDLAGQRGAHQPRVLARTCGGGHDRGRVGHVAQQVVDGTSGLHLVVAFVA
jgi:hypothetical protein